MKYFLFALLCFICIEKSYGQIGSRSYGGIDVEIIKEGKSKRISAKVKITTAFRGGDSAWVKSIEEHLNRTLKFKRKAKADKYFASVVFLIERDGSVVDTKCINDPGFDICEQVRDAILRSKLGRWRPSVDSGKRVREYHTSAIIFRPSPLRYKMDSVRKPTPFPSDLMPPEFASSLLRNEY
ncbi:MAG: hypothetical protein EOO46_11560 [Flavobacterium sp.]|nr:MAG: hypothetical protein EOO46_11560 [Flavobacterium sp.]